MRYILMILAALVVLFVAKELYMQRDTAGGKLDRAIDNVQDAANDASTSTRNAINDGQNAVENATN